MNTAMPPDTHNTGTATQRRAWNALAVKKRLTDPLPLALPGLGV